MRRGGRAEGWDRHGSCCPELQLQAVLYTHMPRLLCRTSIIRVQLFARRWGVLVGR